MRGGMALSEMRVQDETQAARPVANFLLRSRGSAAAIQPMGPVALIIPIASICTWTRRYASSSGAFRRITSSTASRSVALLGGLSKRITFMPCCSRTRCSSRRKTVKAPVSGWR